MSYLFSDPSFWVFVAFLIFIAVALFIKAPSMIAKLLDGEIENIKSEDFVASATICAAGELKIQSLNSFMRSQLQRILSLLNTKEKFSQQMKKQTTSLIRLKKSQRIMRKLLKLKQKNL